VTEIITPQDLHRGYLYAVSNRGREDHRHHNRYDAFEGVVEMTTPQDLRSCFLNTAFSRW
jgi:hypothetical protein